MSTTARMPATVGMQVQQKTQQLETETLTAAKTLPTAGAEAVADSTGSPPRVAISCSANASRRKDVRNSNRETCNSKQATLPISRNQRPFFLRIKNC
jgi:hypothetical protein